MITLINLGFLFIVLIFIPAMCIIFSPIRDLQDRVKEKKKEGKHNKRFNFLDGLVFRIQIIMRLVILMLVVIFLKENLF